MSARELVTILVVIFAMTFGQLFSSAAAPKMAAGQTVPTETQTGSATIIIDSEPSGAEVSINTSVRGVTPLELHDIAPGQALIQLKKKGYWPKKQVVNVANNERLNLGKISLEIRPEVKISTTPAGAMIYLDEKMIDALTPATVSPPPGGPLSVSIKLVLSGYKPWVGRIDFKDKPKQDLQIILENAVPIER